MFAVRHWVPGHGQPGVRNRRQFLISWGQSTSLREWSGARIHLFQMGSEHIATRVVWSPNTPIQMGSEHVAARVV